MSFGHFVYCTVLEICRNYFHEHLETLTQNRVVATFLEQSSCHIFRIELLPHFQNRVVATFLRKMYYSFSQKYQKRTFSSQTLFSRSSRITRPRNELTNLRRAKSTVIIHPQATGRKRRGYHHKKKRTHLKISKKVF